MRQIYLIVCLIPLLWQCSAFSTVLLKEKTDNTEIEVKYERCSQCGCDFIHAEKRVNSILRYKLTYTLNSCTIPLKSIWNEEGKAIHYYSVIDTNHQSLSAAHKRNLTTQDSLNVILTIEDKEIIKITETVVNQRINEGELTIYEKENILSLYSIIGFSPIQIE